MRPYIDFSIDQLEEEYSRFATTGEVKILNSLHHELGFRKTPRAIELKQAVQQSLPGKDNGECLQQGSSTKGPTSRTGPASRSVKLPGAPTTSRPLAFKPTDEQQQAVEAFLTGASLKVNAYAGTGKTSTLELLAGATQGRGQYIAFNRAIVNDARKKFTPNVSCETSHSLALKSTPSKFRANHDKLFGRVNAHKLVELLGLNQEWRVDERHKLKPLSQASIILKTVQRFTQSADHLPSAGHVIRHGSLLTASEETVRAVEEFAVEWATYVWGRMVHADDPIPLGHDGYLKLWALSDPVIAADFIFLDEAQDTNPAVLSVLRKQTAQIIYVGDKYQQIYEWRGAINAMDEIETANTTLLTKSFRFGEAIANNATRVLEKLGEHTALVGNEKVRSRVGPTHPEAILARTNANTITAVIDALDANQAPHLVGGNAEVMEMLRGVQDLKRGEPSTVADFFGFQNWKEVVEFAKNGEGEHLLTFVNLIEARGENQLMWALGKTVDEDDSDIVISTAHKAKGREWNRVRLMDDFLKSQPRLGDQRNDAGKPEFDPAELRLFYVALTRAREEIDVAPEVLAQLGMAASPGEYFQQRPISSKSTTGKAAHPTTHLPQRLNSSPFGKPQNARSGPSGNVSRQPVDPSRPAATLGAPTIEAIRPRANRRGLLAWLLGK